MTELREEALRAIRETVHAFLSYDPITGIWTWKERAGAPLSWNTKYAGKRAGTSDHPTGYRYIRIAGRNYREHRLAFLWMTGAMPVEIDHINGQKADNRWANLRVATTSQNHANMPAPRTNTSGYKGVSWHKRLKRWQASIKVQGRLRFLGMFSTPEEAAMAYAQAANAEFGEFARTK